MKDNDLKVYKAINILFESKDDIEIFNKKAIYLYLREITGLNTKQIVNSLKKFRKRYSNFKVGWENGDIWAKKVLDNLIGEALENIRNDRKIAKEFLNEIANQIATDADQNRSLSPVAAKTHWNNATL